MKDSKLVRSLTVIFGYGVSICALIGLISAFAFLLCFIIGGDFAVNICDKIKILLAWLYRLGSFSAVTGIVKMYLCGQKEFMLEKPDGKMKRR